jgi:Fe-S-cluster containining protein
MSDPHEVLYNQISKAKAPQEFDRALAGYYRECEAQVEKYVALTKPKIDCCSGCNYCCYLRVGVRAHEIFLIANFVQERFTAAQLNSLQQSLVEHVSMVGSLSPFEHQTRNSRCPLLEGKLCGVYQVRPFACRAYHSSDVQSCKHSFDNPTDTSESRDQDEMIKQMWMRFAAYAHGVYMRLGYDSSHYELGTALSEALDNPHCRKRWKRGQKAFLSSQSEGSSHPDWRNVARRQL